MGDGKIGRGEFIFLGGDIQAGKKMRNLHSYRLMWLYCFGFCGCEVGRVFLVGGGWGRRVVGLLTAPFF